MNQYQINFDKNKSRKELITNGWTVIKNVFNNNEIVKLRKDAKRDESVKTIDSDILSNPILGNLVYDERIISILKSLLGGGITYFGEGRLLIESINGRKGGAFHRDNPDRDDCNGPDWKSIYDVVRLGIYLEDHKNHSEGLGFLSGSNNKQEMIPRSFVIVDNAPIEPGDILVWTLTTIHLGYPKRIKNIRGNISLGRGSNAEYGNRYLINNFFYKYLPSFLTNKAGEERIVIHIAYGKTESNHTDRYIEYCKGRSYAVKRWNNTEYSKKLKKRLKKSEITFIDMTKYCNDDLTAKAGGHFQLPY